MSTVLITATSMGLIPIADLGAAAGRGPASPPGFWHELFDGFTWTQAGTILAALIAITGVAATITTNAARARRDRLADLYAAALHGVSDYLEGPYRIRRKDGSAENRHAITMTLSDTKSAIDHSQALLRLHARAGVADAYDAYYAAAKAEAGHQMHEAWKVPAITADAEANLNVAYPRDQSDPLLKKVLEVMQADLAWRWWRPSSRRRYKRAVAAASASATAAASQRAARRPSPSVNQSSSETTAVHSRESDA
jgi:hypothetical protein